MNKTKNFIIFWASQTVSELGSSMTSFALIIWAYKQTQSAMAVSLLTFCTYVPYVLVSIFAGAFVDRHKKKSIMLWSDSVAACCSVVVAVLLAAGRLEIWHIYIVNTIVGFMNSFQSPATTVAVGIMIPEDRLARASGMNSFSSSLLSVITPMLASFISSIWGLTGVIVIDLVTFAFACSILLFVIKIPETLHIADKQKDSILRGCREGFAFLYKNQGIWKLILSMALLNFFSRLTYENILPAMILARSSGSDEVLGVVSGILGMGGILGGLYVSFFRIPKNHVRTIYVSAGISFLFGDLLMGLGRNVGCWCIAGIAASVPIPLISAAQNVIVYGIIPREMQGRVFAVRNAVQFAMIPAGILLGGFLADYVFEPFMKSENEMAVFLERLVGAGTGSGMAVMFLCTGICGFVTSVMWYRSRDIRALK